MAKKSSKETTNLPLVISLVFFVLTTIGFGVMWYMAYSEQEKFVSDKKKAEDDLKNARTITADSERIARVYRIYMGIDNADDKEKLKSETKAGDKASMELKLINEAVAKKTPGGGEVPTGPFAVWLPEADGSIGAMPTTGLIDVAVDANSKKDAAVTQAGKDRTSYAGAIKSFGEAVAALDVARKGFEASAVTLPDDFKKKMAKLDADYASRAKLFAETEAATRKDLSDVSDKFRLTERDLKLELERTGKLKIEIGELVAQVAAREDQSKLDTPLGKVLSRHADGTVEIDLGSDALVKPGMKFTVLPSDYPQKGERSRTFVERRQDVTGVFRPKEQWRPKANVEVVEVRGPNLSICRLIPMHAGDAPDGTPIKRLEYDEIRDRVLKGDLLYHPYWKKGTADHIALVGQFDTNGDGVDDIESVVRDLRAIGVPVDAYFDLRTGKWNDGGRVTARTRTVILGEFPINSGSDPNRDAKTALTAKMMGAIDEAKSKGVRVENYREVFPKMGYYVRVPLPDDKINQATARYLNAAPAEGTPPGSGN
jgi:hypothetical protein